MKKIFEIPKTKKELEEILDDIRYTLRHSEVGEIDYIIVEFV